MQFRKQLSCALMFVAGSAAAGPMGFSDSWMAMGDFSSNWREVFANYALSPRDAVGASATYMRSDDKNTTRELVDLTYTRLLQRWNMKEAQGNLWFIGGLGSVRMKEEGLRSDNRAMISPGVQFDYETTRVYFAVTGRLYRAEGVNHDFVSTRAGFSF